MKYFKKLESERLYLGPLMVNDAKTYCQWINDPSTSDGINKTKDMVTIENETEWLENINKRDDNYNFSIIIKENDTLIGSCAILKVDNINQKAEIGIMIGEESQRNKGYGKETIKMLLDYGFNELNLHNIEIGAYSFNERAVACYKGIGFKEVGRIRENRYHQGKRYDSVILDILKDEFNQNK